MTKIISNKEKQINCQNREYWSIVKGIAIFLVVLGHTGGGTERFVSIFHLAVFFFASGYFYTEEKYGDKPIRHAWLRLKSVWLQYFIYVVLFILLHNMFLSVGIIINTVKYNFNDILINVLKAVILKTYEVLGGALWFVPVLVLSSALFGFFIWAARKLSKTKLFVRYSNSKNIITLVLSLLCAIVGTVLSLEGWWLPNNFHLVFLVMPTYWVAQYLRQNCLNLSKYLNGYVALLIFLVLFSAYKLGLSMTFANGSFSGSIRMYYTFSFAGIYLVLYLAKCIQKFYVFCKYFAFIGKYSFDIMALHFLVMKIIDVIYAFIIGETNSLQYGFFPCAYSQPMVLLYLALGTLIPALIRHGLHLLNRWLKNKFFKRRQTLKKS